MYDTPSEAQKVADDMNYNLIPEGRIAKVYLKLPEKKWVIFIEPFKYEPSYKYLKSVISLTPEERALTRIIPESIVIMAKNKSLIEMRDRIVPYQSSMEDIERFAQRVLRDKLIPYHNPVLKTIKSIKYHCHKQTDIGLCKSDSGLWEHTWKNHNPKYNGNIIGRVTVRNSGICDWEGNIEQEHDKKPIKTIGKLIDITFTDGTKSQFDNHILMTNNSGTLLFIVGDNKKTEYKHTGDEPLILLFYQKGCSACEDILSWIDDIRAKIIKIDCVKDSKIADEFNIEYTPTIIIKNKNKKKRIVGGISKKELVSIINRN